MFKKFVFVNHQAKEDNLNTRIYRKSSNNNEQPEGGYRTNQWSEQPNQTTQVRSATNMERARSKAAGFSAILIIMMLTLAITFTALALNTKGGKPATEDVTAPLAFAMPIDGDFEILMYYSDSELQWNETTQRWEGHKAYDLAAGVGTAVLATYGGTITEISNSSMYGTVVKIQHRDGLVTVYSGLDKNTVLVNRGDYVEKGQRIGSVGNTMSLEDKEPAHVHLEVYKNGKKVNPADYIPGLQANK